MEWGHISFDFCLKFVEKLGTSDALLDFLRTPLFSKVEKSCLSKGSNEFGDPACIKVKCKHNI